MNNTENVEPEILTKEIYNNNYNLLDNQITNHYPLKSNKKRIVLVGHSSSNGGAEILFKNLIKEFKKQDVEVVALVKFDGPLREEYEKLAPTFVIDTIEKIEYYIPELSKYGFKSAILNTILCGNLIPIFHEWGYYVINLVHELPGMVELLNAKEFVKMIGESSDLAVFPSTYVFNKFETMTKVKGNKLIQPQGFYNKYNNFNKKESRQKLEEKYNISQDNHIVLNVGKGEPRKGFDLFLEVSNKLENDKYSFIWVGSIDDDMKEKYKNEIENSKNLILPGYIHDKNEIMSFYDACDVFILTSREDPFPSVVLEAFNASKPVIAFENAGGFKDIIINDKTGFLVKYESVDEIIDKLKLICNDNILKKKLGDNAKELCNQFNFMDYVKILKSYCVCGEEIISLQKDILSLEEDILSLKEDILSLKEDMHLLEDNINSKNEKIISLKNKNKKIAKNKNKKISVKDKKISDLKIKNKKLKKHINKEKRKNEKLTMEKNEILSSSSWKLTKPLRKFKYLLSKAKSKVKPSSNNIPKKNSSNAATHNKKKKGLLKNYSTISTYPYFYKTYINADYIDRINLFFDKLDTDVYKLKNLFLFIINHCNKFNYNLRIIYNVADLQIFNEFLKKNNLTLPHGTTFLNLKKENYLEISLNESYVCTSWKNAKRLINTATINSTIFFYLDDLNEYTNEELFKISNICYNNNVVVLNDDLDKLKKIKKYCYDYDINIDKKMNNENKILCCDFGDMVIEGIEILDYLFLNNILDINIWEINIISQQNLSRCFEDSNKIIKQIPNKLNDFDLFLKLDYNKTEIKYGGNYINLYLKEEVNNGYNIINIINNDEMDIFDNFIPLKTDNSKELMYLEKVFNKLDMVE